MSESTLRPKQDSTAPCDCIAQTNEVLAKQNATLDLMYFFSGKQSMLIRTEVLTKKRGAKAPNLLPTFCPFCGVNLQDAS